MAVDSAGSGPLTDVTCRVAPVIVTLTLNDLPLKFNFDLFVIHFLLAIHAEGSSLFVQFQFFCQHAYQNIKLQTFVFRALENRTLIVHTVLSN